MQLWAHTVQRSRVTRGASERRAAGRLGRRRRLALAVATSVLSIGAAAGPAVTPALAGSGNGRHYQFRTLNNSNDPTFNQLLGINNSGVIAGYFGSGAQGHPNKGYFLLPHYSQLDYRIENFPGSVQTQVTGLNNRGVTVGFWSDQNNANQVNDNFGFYAVGGRRFHTVNFPTTNPATPPVDQLLGVNNHNLAVGFYTDAAGANHGYEYNINRHSFRRVIVSGATSVTAAAINNRNAVAGFFTNAAGATDAFLQRSNGKTIDLAFPRASITQAFGVNDSNEVVGVYQLGTGSAATMHGFTWTARHGFATVDDPNGVGTTTVNGVNDRGQLVGFYVDSAGNTDGMLATPQR